jgi:hypothetical protein
LRDRPIYVPDVFRRYAMSAGKDGGFDFKSLFSVACLGRDGAAGSGQQLVQMYKQLWKWPKTDVKPSVPAVEEC